MAYRETQRVRERKEQTRLAILAAAAALVSAEKPVSMDAVADGAGVSVGSLYSYFRNRRELLQALFDRRAAMELSAMGQALHASQDPAVNLRNAAVLALRRARRNPGMTLFLLLERMDRDAALESAKMAYHRRHCEAFATVLRSAMADQRIPRRNPEVIAAAVLGLIIEIAIRALDPTNEDPLSRLTPAELEAEVGDTVLATCGFALQDFTEVTI